MTRRVARAEPVGEASQPAIPKRTPMTITVVAMLVISEVRDRPCRFAPPA